MNPMKIETTCYQVKDKTVRSQTSGGVIYVPQSWAGKKVRVCLLEPIEENMRGTTEDL